MKKLIPIFALLIFCFYSCKKEVKKTQTQPKEVPVKEAPTPKLSTSNATTGVVGGAHYLCPNNCIGGASANKGNCSVCNTALTHNVGFHNTQGKKVNATPNITPKKPTSGPNASGQYHYTCTNGCAGGGDAAGKCSNCSENLAHNVAFHN